LPCNVIVQETADGKVEASAIDPITSMQALNYPGLRYLAERCKAMGLRNLSLRSGCMDCCALCRAQFFKSLLESNGNYQHCQRIRNRPRSNYGRHEVCYKVFGISNAGFVLVNSANNFF
jgi:hypothetical protein